MRNLLAHEADAEALPEQAAFRFDVPKPLGIAFVATAFGLLMYFEDPIVTGWLRDFIFPRPLIHPVSWH